MRKSPLFRTKCTLIRISAHFSILFWLFRDLISIWFLDSSQNWPPDVITAAQSSILVFGHWIISVWTSKVATNVIGISPGKRHGTEVSAPSGSGILKCADVLKKVICFGPQSRIIRMRCTTNFQHRQLGGQSSDDGQRLQTERHIFQENDGTLRSAVDRLRTLLLLRRTGATSKWEKNSFLKNLFRTIRSCPICYRIESN